MSLSNDPTDLQALTPGHFLIGEPLNSIPEEELTETVSNRLMRLPIIEGNATNLLDQMVTRIHNSITTTIQMETF